MFDTLFARDVQQTLDHFRRSVDQLFTNVYGSSPRTSGTNASTGQNSSEYVFSPVIESGWTDHELCVRAILPGVSEKNVRVAVQGNQLLIEGERTAPENWTKAAYTQLPYGKFYAVTTLPQGVDLDKLTCRLHDGVLDISVPITEAMKPRQISIQSGEQRKAISS
jgi:HSP20 family protein